MRFINYIILSLLIYQSALGSYKLIEYDNPKYVSDSISFFDIEHKKHSFEEYEGKTLLVMFWATWSANAKQSLIYLENLAKDFRKLPIKIIAISEDNNGVEVIKKFYEGQEIKHLPLLYDNRNVLFKELSITGLPTSFVIDPEGRILARINSFINWSNDQVRSLVLSYIPGNQPIPRNSYQDNSLHKLVK